MKEGEAVEDNNSDTIFTNPNHSYTRELVNLKTLSYRDKDHKNGHY